LEKFGRKWQVGKSLAGTIGSIEAEAHRAQIHRPKEIE
jgi:hypothetical protein